MLTLRMDHIGDMAIVECKGRIVRSDATLKLHEAVTAQQNARVVVLDLTQVRALEGGGLGMLWFLQRWAEDHDIHFKLYNPINSVREKLEHNHAMLRFDIVTFEEMVSLVDHADDQYARTAGNCDGFCGACGKEPVSRATVRDWCGVGGDTDPGPVLIDPGVDEAFAVNYGLASLRSLDRDYSDRDGGVSEDTHGERFWCDLLLVAAGRFDAREELGLGFEGAVIFDQDERIVEDRGEGPGVAGLISLVPCLFQSNDLIACGGIVVLRVNKHGGCAQQSESAKSNAPAIYDPTVNRFHLQASVGRLIGDPSS